MDFLSDVDWNIIIPALIVGVPGVLALFRQWRRDTSAGDLDISQAWKTFVAEEQKRRIELNAEIATLKARVRRLERQVRRLGEVPVNGDE